MSASRVEASFGLSPMQLGMLFHHLSAAHSGVDLEQIVCTLREPVDAAALRAAWRFAAERHPALRVAFRWAGLASPVQDVHAGLELPFREEDWSGVSDAEQGRRFEAFLADDRHQGFDFSAPPLARVALFRFAPAEWRMVWTFSHALLDGRSFPLVLGDLFEAYDALRAGRPIPELPPAPRFEDQVRQLAGLDRSGDEAFWRELLAGVTAPTPPPGERPAAEAAPGAVARRERQHRLSEAATTALRELASRHDLSLNTLIQAAWAVLLSRHSGEQDVVFGATRSGRNTGLAGADRTVGLFINTPPVRARLEPGQTVLEFLRALRAQSAAVRAHEHAPLVQLQRWSAVPAGTPLFETVLVYDHASLDRQMKALGPSHATREYALHERTNFPLALYAYGDPQLALKLAWDADRLDDAAAERILAQLESLLEGMRANPSMRLEDLPLLSAAERRQIEAWNETRCGFPREASLPRLFEAAAARHPDRIALRFEQHAVTYRDLNQRANRLAAHLRGLGVERDTLVGVFAERGVEMVVAVLGVMKAGGAYLPLDPEYPADRVAFMLEDSRARVVLTQAALLPRVPASEATVVLLDRGREEYAQASPENLPDAPAPSDLAYVIYTSGSTGRPKGVMVEHRNVVNFFTGMDARIEHASPGVWLAVTSLSFDISVLELLWTLARGFEVVLYTDVDRREGGAPSPARQRMAELDFSLFYFASGEGGSAEAAYRLLLEGARFADTHGFSAVWTPERHFHAFGGLYPNPSVAAAAIASITQRIQIRAGSVVLPLHHPARVAEEWAFVDNISGGRVGIAAASGWHPNDFVLAPQNHARRRELVYEQIDQVRRLWRGEAVAFPGPQGEAAVRTMPRPIQPELPVWVTTAGSIDTYRGAGAAGANLLTHLLGQTFEEVGEKVRAYREARRAAGFDRGHVTLMLHTFVGDDEEAVARTVHGPMKEYLRSAMSLVQNFVSEWTAFSKRAGRATAARGDEFTSLGPEDREALLDFAAERYCATSGLFGTREHCLEILERVAALDIDEIACLVDFGVDPDAALAHLDHLNDVRERASRAGQSSGEAYSLPALLRRHKVTHLQCTPSMARLMLADADTREALRGVRALMIGGEALPGEVAAELRELAAGPVLNMYGPTETTIWSATHRADESHGIVPIGQPIANTTLHVLDAARQELPIGVAGELYIGGEGVARGYWNRPELTAERFVPDAFAGDGARLYRTGDRVRRRPDGALEFLGRADFQVKIRGHRIELGEIESVLVRHPALRAVVVAARDDGRGSVRLVAYTVPMPGVSPPEEELARFAAERLPDFMVPDLFVRLEQFPLTPNGKIDRKALPEPHRAARSPEAGFVAPRTATEEKLSRIWSEVLGVQSVGVHDNFFELGGNSLSTIQISSRIREAFAVDLPLRAIFRTPSVAGIAVAVEDAILTESDDPALRELLDEVEGMSEIDARTLADRS